MMQKQTNHLWRRDRLVELLELAGHRVVGGLVRHELFQPAKVGQLTLEALVFLLIFVCSCGIG